MNTTAADLWQQRRLGARPLWLGDSLRSPRLVGDRLCGVLLGTNRNQGGVSPLRTALDGLILTHTYVIRRGRRTAILKGPSMAVKKATAAANKGERPMKAVPVKAVPAKSPAAKMTASKATTKASATKVTATKAAATASATKATRGRGAAGPTHAADQPLRLRVRENEKPWTAKELAAVRSELEAGLARLQKEILAAEFDLAGLMRDVGDGAGDDPADAGTATFEREQEISLANNAREVFDQSARALARLVDGSYGICESCGSPIGKNRLLAFPRATLCLTCKSKQERR